MARITLTPCKQHTLPSGEEICLYTTDYPIYKPYIVMCVAPDGASIRWSKDFDTLTEATTEYSRWAG